MWVNVWLSDHDVRERGRARKRGFVGAQSSANNRPSWLTRPKLYKGKWQKQLSDRIRLRWQRDADILTRFTTRLTRSALLFKPRWNLLTNGSSMHGVCLSYASYVLELKKCSLMHVSDFNCLFRNVKWSTNALTQTFGCTLRHVPTVQITQKRVSFSYVQVMHIWVFIVYHS